MLRCGWGIFTLLALSTIGASAHLVDVERPIEPFGAINLVQAIDHQKKMKVLAIGRGKIGFGGIYIYDPQGNCVSWDDGQLSGTEDDLAVEFVAGQTGAYTVEVRNLGQDLNKYHIVIK